MRQIKITVFVLLLAAGVLSGQNVKFHSSDSELDSSFAWAKKTAMSYVHYKDIVGDWYEASLPNREAFCMRDVSHQAMGAAVLGLYSQNKNMFEKFAVNIAKSRDWCTYWEINRYDKPAPVDYRNDNDFWYTLTSNFDVIDAIYRMYLWTGDEDYIKNNLFVNFFEKTFKEYRDKWELTPDKIFKRERTLNLYKDGDKKGSKFNNARGIPGYNEGGKGELKLGIDLLAAQAAALKDFARIEKIKGKRDANKWLSEERKVVNLIRNNFWDKKEGKYYSCIYDNGEKDYAIIDSNQSCGHYLIYFGAEYNKGRINGLLDELVRNENRLMVESASHMPEIFFRYGRAKDAVYMIKRLTSPAMHRREYPENSFAVAGAFANGLMGIDPDAPNNRITTISNLIPSISYAELEDVPVFANLITVKHTGITATEFKNVSGKTVRWRASFRGNYKYISVDGKRLKASSEKDIMGNAVSYIDLTVPAGVSITASVK